MRPTRWYKRAVVSTTKASGGEKLWEPGPEAIERSQMTAYIRWLAAERGIEVGDYDSLWRWSVENLEDFWSSIWDYFDVQASRGKAPGAPEAEAE